MRSTMSWQKTRRTFLWAVHRPLLPAPLLVVHLARPPNHRRLPHFDVRTSGLRALAVSLYLHRAKSCGHHRASRRKTLLELSVLNDALGQDERLELQGGQARRTSEPEWQGSGVSKLK